MASAAQISANRENARQSTGPVTPEGKARTSQNALRHGLTARHIVIRPGEQQEFDELERSLLTELDPQGAVETLTFRELLHAAWNLQRFRRIEVELAADSPSALSDPERAPVADRLARYQSRAQRAWFRALRELRTLQTNRALRGTKLDPETAHEVPAIVAINDLTKQTHSEVTAEAIQQAIHLVDLETGVFRLRLQRDYEARTRTQSAAEPSDAGTTGMADAPFRVARASGNGVC
jgi:hypothetical protein